MGDQMAFLEPTFSVALVKELVSIIGQQLQHKSACCASFVDICHLKKNKISPPQNEYVEQYLDS